MTTKELKQYCPFDIANALYHFLQHNWNGIDDLYRDFCKLTNDGNYKPSRHDEMFDNITEDALEIYNQLTENNYSTALYIVLNYEEN